MGDPWTSLGIGVGVSLASRLLNPGQRTTNRVRNEANRIEDLGAPDANYGYPIRELLGVCRVNGCSMIWARPLREEITTSTETQFARQGKGLGGSRQTTITETETATYYFTAAFLIGGRINRLERVWANGVQIYKQGDNNDIVNAFGGYTELYFGDQTAPSPTIISYEGEAPTFNGYSYIVFDEYPIELYKGSGFPRIDIEVYGKYTETSPERLNFYNSIIHVTNLAGVPESSIDLTGTGPGVVMYGATFENNGETYASYLDDLALVHSLDYREENGKLKIYTRFGTPGSAIQIKRGALSARQYGEEIGDIYLRKRLDPISLPSEVRIDFLSRTKELNRNNVFYQDASAEHSKSDRITTRIVTNEADMTSLAARLLYQAKTESHTIEDLYLMPSYAGIRVGDFIGIQERDINRMYRVTEVTISEDYRVKVSAVGSRGMFDYDESDTNPPPAYTPIALPDIVPTPDVETNYPPVATPLVGTASLIPLDINLIRSQDASGTLYVAVDGDANWVGGGIYLSRDAGASYTQVSSSSQSSITGTVAIATPAGSGLDTTTVIQVAGVNGQLSSVTQAKFDLGQGLVVLVGDEIIMARDAILVSPGVYDLSYLQRGYRGTEWATGGHGANENFYLLSGPLGKIQLTPDDIGRTLRIKAVGLYGSEPNVTNYTEFTFAGISWKPWAGIDLLSSKNQGGTIYLAWTPRDIGGGQLYPQSFEVDVKSGAVVVRTIESEVPSITYRDLAQIEDFGSVQTTITIDIYQLSPEYGRGYLLTGTVTPEVGVLIPVIDTFSPSQGEIGASITIYGQGFSGATTAAIGAVTLDNVVVVDDYTITGNIAEATVTGKVSVTNSIGTGESITDFVIVSLDVDFADIGGFARDNADLESEIETLETAIAAKMTITDYDSLGDGVVDVAASVEGVDIAGNSKYYGTDETGSEGFYDLPTDSTKTKNIESIASTKALILTDAYFQFLTPTAASVIVKLPSVTGSDYFECEIVNISTSNALAIQENDGTAITTLVNTGDKSRSIYAYWDGVTWQVWIRGYY